MEDMQKIQSQNVQIFGYVYKSTNGPNHGPVWMILPLERNLYGHPLAGLLRERQFEKVSLEHGWEKILKLGMFIYQPSKRTIPISVCGRYQTGRQDRKHRTDLENSDEKR